MENNLWICIFKWIFFIMKPTMLKLGLEPETIYCPTPAPKLYCITNLMKGSTDVVTVMYIQVNHFVYWYHTSASVGKVAFDFVYPAIQISDEPMVRLRIPIAKKRCLQRSVTGPRWKCVGMWSLSARHRNWDTGVVRGREQIFNGKLFGFWKS